MKVPEFVKTYRVWIPHTVQEIEDRVRLIKTIIKHIEFGEDIKLIKCMSQSYIG